MTRKRWEYWNTYALASAMGVLLCLMLAVVWQLWIFGLLALLCSYATLHADARLRYFKEREGVAD